MAQITIGVEDDNFNHILETLDTLSSIGVTHGLVAADFGTGRVGQQDGALICLKLASETQIFPIGLTRDSGNPLSGALMNFRQAEIPNLINILTQWNRW